MADPLPADRPPVRALPSPTDLLTLADQCVKCGYCLPHCPTFRAARCEADSPRGRIALIQGWLGGEVAPTPALVHHLDGCLLCRACEPVCPSLVRFATLMDGARALRMARRPGPLRGIWQAALDLLADPRRLGSLAALAQRLELTRLGIQLGDRLWPRLAVLARLGEALRPPRSLPAPPSAGGQPVSLFRGCIARLSDPDLEAATLRVLTLVRVPVQVPEGQVCCGAMHRHNGLPVRADALLATNRSVFGTAPVVGTASACVAELREQGGFAAEELCRLLLRHWPKAAPLRPFFGTIAVHEPCSHRNQLGDTGAVYELLRRIPGATVLPLPGNDTCCGAAGTYLIQQPTNAAALGEAKLAALATLRPDLVVTTNTGCALQLRTLIAVTGLAVEVLHPVVLLDRLLAD